MKERRGVWRGTMLAILNILHFCPVSFKSSTLLVRVCVAGSCVRSCPTPCSRASAWLTHREFCQERNRELVEVRCLHLSSLSLFIYSREPISCSVRHPTELWTTMSAFPLGACECVFTLTFGEQDCASFISTGSSDRKRWALTVSHMHTPIHMHMHSSEMHGKKASDGKRRAESCKVTLCFLRQQMFTWKVQSIWNEDKWKDFYTSIWTKLHFNHMKAFWYWLVSAGILYGVTRGRWWAGLGVKRSFPAFQGPALLAFPKPMSSTAIASFSFHKRVWIIKEAT